MGFLFGDSGKSGRTQRGRTFSFLFGGDGHGNNEYNRINPGEGSAMGRLQALYGKSEAELRGGYDEVIGEVDRVGRGAGRQIRENEQRRVADAAVSTSDRGLYGSGTYDSIVRGAGADADRNLADLSEGIAGLRGGVLQQRTESLARFYQMQWASESQIYNQALEGLIGSGAIGEPGYFDFVNQAFSPIGSLVGAASGAQRAFGGGSRGGFPSAGGGQQTDDQGV